MNTNNLTKLAIFLLFLGAVIALFVFFDVREYLSIEALRSQVDMWGIFAPIFFITLYALATLFFLPGTPLSIASGVLFGALFGALYTIIGATIGASLAFLFSRYVGKNFTEDLLKSRLKKVYEYDEKLEHHGFAVVLFLRLVPLFPFNGLNFALGLTKVSFRDYFFGTLIGIIPAVFIFAYFGSSLAMLMPLQIAIAVVLLLLLIFVPSYYKKHYEKKHGKI